MCADKGSEETRHTGETGRVLVCGVQKKKGETEMCGVKMKEGDREEREKPGSEAGSAY